MTSPAANAVGEHPAPAMVVSVGAVEYAVSGRVSRSLPAVRPLPPTVPHEGHEFPVLDLPRLFGAGGGDAGEGGELMLLVEQDELRRALVVHGLAGFCELDPELLQPVPGIYPRPERDRWHGLLVRPDGRVLAVPRLAELPAGSGSGDGGSSGGGSSGGGR